MKNIYKLRISIIFIIFAAVSTIILTNLFIIQVKLHSFYTHLGKQQYQVSAEQYPPRASILDRHGNPLAQNQEISSAFILPHSLHHKTDIEKFLLHHYPAAHSRLLARPDSQFLYIKRKIDVTDKTLFEKCNLQDIKFLQEPHRYYPLEQSAAQLIGTTNIDNQGNMGLELYYDKQLSGEPTTCFLEKDARSEQFYFKQESCQPGISGGNLMTTIDSNIQYLTFRTLKKYVKKYNAAHGAAIIMEPNTGEIIALTSYPSFNPHITNNINLESTKNIPVTNVYELGSVMKIFGALAALQEGVVTADEPIDCQGTKTAFVHGISINTPPSTVNGVLPFHKVIQKSNNIGIVTVAQRLGTSLYDHYKELGFGTKTNIDLPGEQAGFINPPHNWSKRSFASLSFGYEITGSLVQLARALSVIINGGYLVQPHINKEHPYKTVKQRTMYSTENLNITKDILINTVNEGTASRAKIKNYTILGKTGTANLLINGNYDPDHNRFTFAGALEKGSYQRVIITFIEDAAQTDLYASQVTTPLFKEIAESIIIHDKIL